MVVQEMVDDRASGIAFSRNPVTGLGEVVVEDASSWGTFVNDERVPGRAVVAAGDRVRVGGIELLLIAEAEE